jgi:hypothetical protein
MEKMFAAKSADINFHLQEMNYGLAMLRSHVDGKCADLQQKLETSSASSRSGTEHRKPMLPAIGMIPEADARSLQQGVSMMSNQFTSLSEEVRSQIKSFDFRLQLLGDEFSSAALSGEAMADKECSPETPQIKGSQTPAETIIDFKGSVVSVKGTSAGESSPDSVPSRQTTLSYQKSVQLFEEDSEHHLTTLEENMWDATLLIGSGHMGKLGGAMALIALLLNISLQSVCLGIVVTNFAHADSLPLNDSGARRWRETIGHDWWYSYEERPVSVVSRICNEDPSLAFETMPKNMISDINSYLAYRLGPLLCLTMITIWYLAVVGEFQNGLGAFSGIPKPQESCRQHEDYLASTQRCVLNQVNHVCPLHCGHDRVDD